MICTALALDVSLFHREAVGCRMERNFWHGLMHFQTLNSPKTV
jgi:hypothetical protein